jgi:cytosine/adenosine deaminase-related metal-dependent hydrolase
MLYAHAALITINPSREIILDSAILVHGNKIANIAKTETLKAKYPHEEIVDLSGRIVFSAITRMPHHF